MHYIVLATHTAEICPTSNSKTRKLVQESAPDIPAIAEKTGVRILAGPYVNREHISVAIVDAKTVEDLDQFLMSTRLPQWNSVRVIPSVHIEQGIQELQDMPTVF